MDNVLARLIIFNQAEQWLKENPLQLNNQEKQKFLVGLREYLDGRSKVMDDEVYDFLIQKGFLQKDSRDEAFAKYLLKKHKTLQGKKILDVGAGRICCLSKAMVKRGAIVTAMDANIRLPDGALRREGVRAIRKPFRCDEYSKNNLGTDISAFDLVVGLEPCDATEHIIRQALKYRKPFEICLCAAPHKALDGKWFLTYEKWYEHLASISQEVCIEEHDSSTIATNNKSMEL